MVPQCPTMQADLLLNIFEDRWVNNRFGGKDRLRLSGHRLLRFIIHKAHEGDGRDIVVRGGVKELAKASGSLHPKQSLLDILRSGVDYHFNSYRTNRHSVKYSVSGLWLLYRGAIGQLAITPAHCLRDHVSIKGKVLVPVLPSPPRVGTKGNEWIAQSRLQVLLVDLLARRKEELIRHGHVQVSDEEFSGLARRAGMLEDWLPVIRQWSRRSGQIPPMLSMDHHGQINIGASGPWAPSRAFLMGDVSAP